MGRNRPAEAMPFDGMVRRYLIIYIVNLLLHKTSTSSAVQQIMRSVLHTTPHTYSNFSPARSDSTLVCVREGARTGSIFQLTLDFIQAVARRKLHLQFLRAIPLFTFTHDSRVMSTICQNMLWPKTSSTNPRSTGGSRKSLFEKEHEVRDRGTHLG